MPGRILAVHQAKFPMPGVTVIVLEVTSALMWIYKMTIFIHYGMDLHHSVHGGDCQKSCGGTISSLCWWTSSCGNSARCWTGKKVLCGYPWCRIGDPFIKYVSSLLQ